MPFKRQEVRSSVSSISLQLSSTADKQQNFKKPLHLGGREIQGRLKGSGHTDSWQNWVQRDLPFSSLLWMEAVCPSLAPFPTKEAPWICQKQALLLHYEQTPENKLVLRASSSLDR